MSSVLEFFKLKDLGIVGPILIGLLVALVSAVLIRVIQSQFPFRLLYWNIAILLVGGFIGYFKRDTLLTNWSFWAIIVALLLGGIIGCESDVSHRIWDGGVIEKILYSAAAGGLLVICIVLMRS